MSLKSEDFQSPLKSMFSDVLKWQYQAPRHWDSRCRPEAGYHVWPCPECPEFFRCAECGCLIRQREGSWVEDISTINERHLAAVHERFITMVKKSDQPRHVQFTDELHVREDGQAGT